MGWVGVVGRVVGLVAVVAVVAAAAAVRAAMEVGSVEGLCPAEPMVAGPKGVRVAWAPAAEALVKVKEEAAARVRVGAVGGEEATVAVARAAVARARAAAARAAVARAAVARAAEVAWAVAVRPEAEVALAAG